MKKLFAFALLTLSVGSFESIAVAQQTSRPFKISFEMLGKKVETKLTLRIKHDNKLTEIKYSANDPILFPDVKTGQRFDLWIITDDYTFPFLDMHPDALTVADWRVGVDVRPFHLDYMELRLQSPQVKFVYYLIYQDADGGETPIWAGSTKPLKDFRN